MRVLGLLCVMLCGICTANAASQSLKYIYSVVTGDTDSPEFIITGLVNDEQFVHYDSNIRRMIPKTEWIEKSVDKQYWDKQTQKALYAHQIFKDNIGIAMQHFRSTQVAPEVSLLQKDSSSPVITCHVTEFYPRDIMVTWQRNGEDLDVDVELGETVRNEDGTFQTTSHLRVKPEDWKSQNYTCTVQHKSLKQGIVLSVKEENIKRNTDIKTRSFNPDGSSPPKGVLIGCVVGALILTLALALAVIGFVIWKKRPSARSFIPEDSSSSLCRTPSSSSSPSSVSSIGRRKAPD